MKKFKIQNSRFKIAGFLSLCCTAALLLFCSSSSAELTINTNHDHISIDFSYHGSEVAVSGVSAAGADLIIKIASPEGRQSLRKKGKAAGFLWMNVGELKFENTPALYFMRSTKKLEGLLDEEEMGRYLLGYSALERHAEIAPVSNPEEKARWFDEFVRFKESSRLYSISHGDISVAEKDGKQNYHISLSWPYQAVPGDYTVTVYAVKDKRVIETAMTQVRVEQVGGIKFLADMAKNKGALYGIISIIVALAAGFGVGMIFRKGGAH